MNIELSMEQYQAMVKMLSVAETILISTEDDPEEYMESRFNDVFQHVLSYAHDFGLGDAVEEVAETGEILLTDEFKEESGIFEIVSVYNEEFFWEELLGRMVERDLISLYGEEALQNMAIEEKWEKAQSIEERYEDEFQTRGVQNLKLTS